MDWPVLIAQLMLALLFGNTLYRIVFELFPAIARAKVKPTERNRVRLKIVVVHQAILLALTYVVWSFTRESLHATPVNWIAYALGMIYLWWIRDISDVDDRFKVVRKQQRERLKQAAQTPDMEEGAR